MKKVAHRKLKLISHGIYNTLYAHLNPCQEEEIKAEGQGVRQLRQEKNLTKDLTQISGLASLFPWNN